MGLTVNKTAMTIGYIKTGDQEIKLASIRPKENVWNNKRIYTIILREKYNLWM